MFISLRQQEAFIDALKKEFEDLEVSVHEVVESRNGKVSDLLPQLARS